MKASATQLRWCSTVRAARPFMVVEISLPSRSADQPPASGEANTALCAAHGWCPGRPHQQDPPRPVISADAAADAALLDRLLDSGLAAIADLTLVTPRC